MDSNARHELVRTAIDYAPELTRFFKSRVSVEHDTQDLMQELYLALLKVPGSQAIRHPKAYLFTVAGNLVHQHWQRSRARPVQVGLDDVPVEFVHGAHPTVEANDPVAAAMVAERLAQLEQRLNKLSVKVQAAILWHHRDGYTCDEVSKKLSVVTHRVKKYLVHGLIHCRAVAAASDQV